MSESEQNIEVLPENWQPLIPKQINYDVKKPPGCPLKDIQFIQIEKFIKWRQNLAKMAEGFDQLGKKNMMRINRQKQQQYDKEKEAVENRKMNPEQQEAKMDEFTHIIQNIVYARDPKIFDTKSGFVNQRNAFMHENMLDIKSMIRLKDERENAERYGLKFQPPRRPPKTKQEIDYEYELAQKAKYKLRKLENGEPDPSDKTLLFESKFESGNLYLA